MIPVDILRTLIQNNGKKLASKKVTHTFEKETDNSGDISAQIVKGVDINLWGTAFEVSSDRSGYKKIYLYGTFEWLQSPSWELVDKLSIGYPVTTEWFLPFDSNGNVAQHQNRYGYKPDNQATSWTWQPVNTKASDWDNGTGVAAGFDLLELPSNLLHKGYVGQYVYVRSTKSGTFNVKFKYGHRILSGIPTVSIYPAGLAVTPEYQTETVDYGIEFTY